MPLQKYKGSSEQLSEEEKRCCKGQLKIRVGIAIHVSLRRKTGQCDCRCLKNNRKLRRLCGNGENTGPRHAELHDQSREYKKRTKIRERRRSFRSSADTQRNISELSTGKIEAGSITRKQRSDADGSGNYRSPAQ